MKHNRMKQRRRQIAKVVIGPDPILRQVCEPVVTGDKIQQTVQDMMSVLVTSKNGVGLSARIVQHEIDHLNGICIVGGDT